MSSKPNPEADIKAVVAVMDAAGALPFDQFHAMPDLAAALNALYEQFEDRINAHDKAARLKRLTPIVGEDVARAEVYGSKDGG